MRSTARWPGLRSISLVEARRMVGEKTTVEQRYSLTSLGEGAQRFGQAVRSHWGIETGWHWVLDVAFHEDPSRRRRAHAAENFTVLRHLALSRLCQETSGRPGLKVKRLKAAWDHCFLPQVLFV